MIGPVTRWLEIVHYNDKHSATIFNLVDKSFICGYPIPTIITYNHRN